MTCFTSFGSESLVDEIVVTVAGDEERARQIPTRRTGRGSFVATAELAPGPVQLGVVAQTRDETRLRGVFELSVPGG